jgi:prepilin-type N-terminal cleavage/methylation domain-containing protein/prepilin-type processing-associated H-X9-DG protein
VRQPANASPPPVALTPGESHDHSTFFDEERRMKKHGQPAGFTLVELLVVIGIIALLISVLMPALGKARAAANRAVCLARMREMSNASQMYAAENKGFFPPIWNGSDWPSVHFDRPAIFPTTGDPKNTCYLSKYMGVGNTANRYICPALQGNANFSITGNQSYRYNVIIGGSRGPAIQQPNPLIPGHYFTRPYKTSEIRQASKMALFLDSDTITSGLGNAMWFRLVSPFTGNPVGKNYTYPNFTGNFQTHNPRYGAGTYTTAVGLTYPIFEGQTNVAYCDGSVRATPFRVDSSPPGYQGPDFLYMDPAHPQDKW